MWVADDEDYKIYAYRMSDRSRISDGSRDFDTLIAAGNERPTGIWSDGETMWVADNGDDKIYAYNLTSKARDTGKDFNTLDAAENNYPQGIWSDGETMWVADGVDETLYAYSMADRARVSGKDFGTLDAAGMNYPTHIWSDGDTMWVVDDGEIPEIFPSTREALDKIYSYNFPPSGNADLRELGLSGIELAPAFAGGTTSYTATASVASTTVTATPVQRFAQVVISPARRRRQHRRPPGRPG